MTTILADPTNSIDILLENLTTITTISQRNIKKYASLAANVPKMVQEDPLPFSMQLQAILTDSSAFETTKRKLTYMDRFGSDILLCLGSEEEAVLGGVEMNNLPRGSEKSTIMEISMNFVGKGTVLGYMKEGEDCTKYSGGATETIVNDANASGGQVMRLDAQNEGAYFVVAQSLWALPIANYRMYIRAKDSTHVATDCGLQVYNSTDSTVVGSTTKTLTATYAWYSLDFTTDSGDNGDTIRFVAYKNTVTANSIDIDLIAVVMV